MGRRPLGGGGLVGERVTVAATGAVAATALATTAPTAARICSHGHHGQ